MTRKLYAKLAFDYLHSCIFFIICSMPMPKKDEDSVCFFGPELFGTKALERNTFSDEGFEKSPSWPKKQDEKRKRVHKPRSYHNLYQ